MPLETIACQCCHLNALEDHYNKVYEKKSPRITIKHSRIKITSDQDNANELRHNELENHNESENNDRIRNHNKSGENRRNTKQNHHNRVENKKSPKFLLTHSRIMIP